MQSSPRMNYTGLDWVHLTPVAYGYSPVLRFKIAKRHTVGRATQVLLKPGIIQELLQLFRTGIPGCW
jgi:hypothetical protein